MENKEVKAGFFVKRPIFSTVISILIVIVGLVSIKSLPIEQYPNLTPPQVLVKANYTGASADVVAQSVASLLESQINGVENMIYMTSVSSGTGALTLTVTFAIGTDPNQATIDVNNRVQLAMSQLPTEVQRMGVTVVKSTPTILLIVFLSSPDERFDSIYLSNYASLNIVDELKLVPGVGDVTNFASQNYAMRLWLNPEKMSQLNITPKDIAAAIGDQNSQFAAGRIGEPPFSSNDVELTWQIITTGRLKTPEEFENIMLRTEANGSILRLKDVARVELGAESYNFRGKENGKTAIPIGVYLAPEANALEVADGIKSTMAELSKQFPSGISYNVPYDTTKFIKISIQEVVKTLFEAMLLVFIVVFIFLQKWRATLIPCLAVPVSIIGTFAGMYLFGFSINSLTMFGLVLAIGMVVDDAIVVLENVEQHLSKGLTPFEATKLAMHEVTRPVIAIVIVLIAVFLPVAFTGGLAGIMYKQFAITIAISVVISGVVALTFTPALCALILKKHDDDNKVARPFQLFNIFFESVTNGYLKIVKVFMHNNILSIGIFVIMILATWFLFTKLPTGLVPNEDQGYIMALLIMPDGASIERTSEVMNHLDNLTMKDETVADVMSFTGMDILSGALKSNYASVFISMKPWDERKKADQSSYALVDKYFALGAMMPEGLALAFNPPPIIGMSATGGFETWIQNRTDQSSEGLDLVLKEFIKKAGSDKRLSGVSSTFTTSSPQLFAMLDREKAATLGVSVSDVFSTMQSTFGSFYINDFNLYGRTYRVFAQSDGEFRQTPDDIRTVHIKNNKGDMVPLSSLIDIKRVGGLQTVERFNNFNAAKVMGSAAVGYSSGDAILALEEIAKEVLPDGYTLGWSGTSYQEKRLSGSGNIMLLVFSLIVVFLILAAQYESWSLPITVITAIPFAVFGAVIANLLRGYENDVYFQVALVTLIGLSAKNAILIVEFAIEKYHEGMSIADAALEGARLRFRPIIMTSFAFIFGVIPLAFSSGAGSASRHAIGTSVIGGMIFATVFAPMFVPYFFRLVMSITEKIFGKGEKHA